MANDGDNSLVDADKDSALPDEAPFETSEAAVLPEAQPSAPAPRKPRSHAWVGYLTLVIVLVLAGAGYLLMQELRSKQGELGGELNKEDQQMIELARQVSGLQQQLATLHNQVAGLQTQLTTEDSKLERLLGEHSATFGERLELTKKELNQVVERIQRQLSRTRGDILVADAEYLLGVANQKLHLVGDVKAVLAALEAADQRLHDSGDPGVFPVREALAEEINLLKNLNPPDVVGLSARILALEAKVKELPLFLPTAAPSQGAPKLPEPEPPSSGGVLDSALDELKDLVTVRRTDRPIESVLTPEEVEGLRQILLLKLEMTRASLLRSDEALYRSNLESARDWLRSNFRVEDDATRRVDDELSALLDQKINVALPDISKSLGLIRNIEHLRLKAEEAAGPQAAPQQSGAQP